MEKSEGFWTEFFLLKPHPPGLVAQIAPLTEDDLLHLQSVTRQLFERNVAAFKIGHSPQDEVALDVSYTPVGSYSCAELTGTRRCRFS